MWHRLVHRGGRGDLGWVLGLEPRVDGEVKLAEMYMDYQVWCRWRGDVPFNRNAFGNQFKELAAAAGIRSVVRNRADIYLDMRFAGRAN